MHCETNGVKASEFPMRHKNLNPRRSASALVLLMIIALLFTACGTKSDNSGNETGAYRKSLNVVDEGGAVRTLQTIHRAQTQYMLSHAEEYATFDQLVKDNYLDSRFVGDRPVVGGYAFSMKVTPKSGIGSAEYSVYADPMPAGGTSTAGARHLYMDSASNVVHANARQQATATDPPVQ